MDETLTKQEREALGIMDQPEEPVKKAKRGPGRPSNEELAARKAAKTVEESPAEKARREMLASFGTESDEVFLEPKSSAEVDLEALLAGITIDVSNFEVVEKNPLELFEEKSIIINGRSTFETVCNQSAYVAHMESLKYSDMAALENSTKYTNSTEEELLERLSKTIGDLIGSDTTDGALKNVIDNLAVDLHNYEQITDELINVELKDSITNLSTITDDLQTEVQKQLDTIMIDSNSTSNQLRDFRTELNKVSTDTLVQRFSNLSGAIEDFIKTLQPEISYDQDVYSVANDIAWNKVKWQQAWDIGDTATQADM